MSEVIRILARVAVAAVTVTVLAALGAAGLGAAPAVVVVVAPLHDASPSADADLVSGVRDLLAAALAEQAVVVDRQKLQAVLSEQRLSAAGLADVKTAVRIGELLKADYLLTGSLFRQPDKIEIAVQLLAIPSGAVAKGITVSGRPDKLLDLANDVARQAAAALRSGPAQPAAAAPPTGPAANPNAEQYFLLALASHQAGDFDQAIMNCLKAIQLDPNNVRARLRLAESFLGAGDLAQARVTVHRALELFPTLPLDPRLTAILDRTDPLALPAVADQPLTVQLPGDWPADAKVAYVMMWQGQPAVRDAASARQGAVAIKMPGARVPLTLTLELSTAGRAASSRQVRLWPVGPEIKLPSRRLVTADATKEFEPHLEKLAHKRFNSCDSIPEPEVRFVVAPGAVARITANQAEELAKFVAAGGELVLVGQAPAGTTIAGVQAVAARWPGLKSWTADPQAPFLSYLPAVDAASLLARAAEAALLRGGRPWLSADGGDLAMIAESSSGPGRMLWIAWPGQWNSSDPRAIRLLALALGEAITLPAAPAKADAKPSKDRP